MPEPGNLKCEVCDQVREPLFVSSLPGIPMSVGRCLDCIEADAVPLWIAVATTADIGGMHKAADWWVEVVASTLEHLHVPIADFNKMVQKSLDDPGPIEPVGFSEPLAPWD